MTAEEKIVKIKEILRNTVGENHPRESREDIQKEILQFTIDDLIDCIVDIEEMFHCIYDTIEG